ncbi:MAG: RDD family protein [Bacteroidota bacterium]
MQQVEINTSQNVKIEYQLASIWQRIFAFALDFIIISVVYLILAFGLLLMDFNESNFMTYVFYGIMIIWVWFYTLFSEIIGNGQTIGKRALGIKVVKLNGDEMEFYDFFSRWSVRLFDIYLSIGTVAMLLISSNKAGQRMGDIISGTTVIKRKSTFGFRLSDILKLNENNKEEYAFEYPNARLLNEKDVILIKNTVFRYRQFSNTAHADALDTLVNRICEILEISPNLNHTDNKIKFLNKVVSEYIILTR